LILKKVQRLRSKRNIKHPRVHTQNNSTAKRMFIKPSKASYHPTAVHLSKKTPYSLTDEFNCEKMFKDLDSANLHANIHGPRTKLPCPLAEKFNCGTMFAQPRQLFTRQQFMALGILHAH
jgi:hypothetical protein